MPAKVCPSCGLKSPQRAIACDCGYGFAPSAGPRTCAWCERVSDAGRPICACGQWLDDEARRAYARFWTDRRRARWMVVGGIGLLFVGVLLRVSIVLPVRVCGGGAALFMIVSGARRIAHANQGIDGYDASDVTSRRARFP